MADSCATCFFFGPNQNAAFPASCRQFAPPILNLNTGAVPGWPPVASTDWCGDFSAVAKGNPPWVSYVPVITSTVGTITTLGAMSARYQNFGNYVHLWFSISITTNGSGAGKIQITIPLPFQVGLVIAAAGAGVRTSDFKALSVELDSVGAIINCTLYDGTYPGADAVTLVGSLLYQYGA